MIFSVKTSSWKGVIENHVCPIGDGIKSNSTTLVERNVDDISYRGT